MYELGASSLDFELDLELKPARKPVKKKKTGPGNSESSEFENANNSNLVDNSSISETLS